jgi:aldehyde:ferredoxin oxidoreductase
MAHLTGLEWKKADLKQVSTRIRNMVRHFNIREGLVSEDDKLPERLHRNALQGQHEITQRELRQMLADYYRLRGWSPEGYPPEPEPTS